MVTDPNAPTAWFTANKGASDVKIRRAQDANKWSNEDVAKAIGADTGKWSARYNAATPYVNFAGLFDNVLAGDFVNPLAENS